MIKIKPLRPRAIAPTYATDGSGAFDLHTTGAGTIQPGQARAFGTGLAFEVPTGYVMLMFSRSGDGFKRGVRLANAVGVIDADYRGEVLVKLHNDGEQAVEIEPGQRIAQAMVIPVPRFPIVIVDELADTARGTGGIGSTGQ